MTDAINSKNKSLARLEMEFGGMWPLRTVILKAINKLDDKLIHVKTIGSTENNENGFFEFVLWLSDHGYVLDAAAVQNADRELRITADAKVRSQVEGHLTHLIDVAGEVAEAKLRKL